MCGRYYIDEDLAQDEIREIIEKINRGKSESERMKLGEVCPGDIAPVVSARGATLMRWGYERPGGKGLIINARSETAREKPMFSRGLRAQRLVVPASGYYEWQRPEKGEKVKYAFSREGEPLYMAGLWRTEPDKSLPSFVILTTDAAPSVRFVHDRMPVLLGRGHLRAWLRDDTATQKILRDLELQVRFGVV